MSQGVCYRAKRRRETPPQRTALTPQENAGGVDAAKNAGMAALERRSTMRWRTICLSQEPGEGARRSSGSRPTTHFLLRNLLSADFFGHLATRILLELTGVCIEFADALG